MKSLDPCITVHGRRCGPRHPRKFDAGCPDFSNEEQKEKAWKDLANR